MPYRDPANKNAYDALWRQRNAERKRATDAAWRQRNAERKRATNAAYRAKNGELISLGKKICYERNKARYLSRIEQWRAANVEKVREIRRNHARKCIEELRESYVVHRIRDAIAIDVVDIPRELIEAKRVHMELRRKLKKGRDDETT